MENNNIYETEEKSFQIKWSDDFIIDNGKIDEQHKTIITLVNLLFDENYSDVQRTVTLPLIIEYMERHIAYEEDLMIDIKYPYIDEQKEHHQHFSALIKDFESERNKSELISEEEKEYLRIWWGDHILKEDMKYKPYLKNK